MTSRLWYWNQYRSWKAGLRCFAPLCCITNSVQNTDRSRGSIGRSLWRAESFPMFSLYLSAHTGMEKVELTAEVRNVSAAPPPTWCHWWPRSAPAAGIPWWERWYPARLRLLCSLSCLRCRAALRPVVPSPWGRRDTSPQMSHVSRREWWKLELQDGLGKDIKLFTKLDVLYAWAVICPPSRCFR